MIRCILCLLLAAAMAACVPAPARRAPPAEQPADAPPVKPYPYRRAPGPLPQRAEEISGPAVMTLLEQARQELDLGRAEQALAALERAQRIEPRNPFVWQQLALAHLYLRRMDEAEDLAQRANSLARGNPYIEIENWRVIAAARQARGDAAGVQEADARMAAMQESLDD